MVAREARAAVAVSADSSAGRMARMQVLLFSVRQAACNSVESLMTGMVGLASSMTTGSGVSSSLRLASGDSVGVLASSSVSSAAVAAAEDASDDLCEAEALENLLSFFLSSFFSFFLFCFGQILFGLEWSDFWI